MQELRLLRLPLTRPLVKQARRTTWKADAISQTETRVQRMYRLLLLWTCNLLMGIRSAATALMRQRLNPVAPWT